MASINLTAAEKQVEAAKLKLQQATNRLRQLNAKETAKQAAQERKDRDRRLIITGAVVETWAAQDEAFKALLMKRLDEGIPENRNRRLFGLADRPERTPDNERKSVPPSEGGTGGGG